MGTVLLIFLVLVVGLVAWNLLKDSDKNDDGQVDLKDVVAAAKEVADDVKEVTTNVKTEVVEVATEATAVVAEKVKKVRKPRAKKKA